MKKAVLVILAIILWGVALLGVTWSLGGFSFDLSSKKIYTLSQASKDMVKNLDTELTINLYVSDNLDRENHNYAEYVTAILSSYQKVNPEKVKFAVKRLKDDDKTARFAAQKGIMAIPDNNGYAYFALEMASPLAKAVIAKLEYARANYLENDINRIIKRITIKNKTIIGVVAPQNKILTGWSIIDELAQDYTLMNIDPKVPYIPHDIKALIVINPGEVGELFVYSLDQYLMSGGKIIVFVDPYSEVTHREKGYPPKPHTDLKNWLTGLGLDYDYNKVIGSLGAALNVGEGGAYPLWFFVSGAGYKNLSFRSAGGIKVVPEDGLKYEILAKSPDDSGQMDVSFLRYSSKKEAAKHYQGGNESFNLAVMVSGQFISGFDKGYFDNTEYSNSIPPFLPISVNNPKILIVADSDFVSDDAWILKSDAKNKIYGSIPYADNGEFILFALDNMLNDAKEPYFGRSRYNENLNITARIAAPLIEASMEEKNRLNGELNSLNQEIEKLKFMLESGNDKGKNLQYRRQINELEQKIDDLQFLLSKQNTMITRTTGEKIRMLIWLNAVVFPILTAVVLFLVVWLKRNTARYK
ncbi:MAG: Gldg family protein [Alphaproteobacteria bacterium]|nr:Gldg family protein [Alphaproteobacteria bacterium]